MKLHIIAVGKLKELFWQEAAEMYQKRLRPFAKIKIIELPEESFKENDPSERVKEKEAERIRKHIPPGSIVIACDEHGKDYTSPDLALFLADHSQHGDTITFLIGGSLGLGASILDLAKYTFSLSHFTFPHELARIILLEQLYRSATIIAKKTYHY